MKRHMLKARGSAPTLNMAACGLRAPPQFTIDPTRVTCLACRRTLFMADEELRLQRGAKQRHRTEKRSSTDD